MLIAAAGGALTVIAVVAGVEAHPLVVTVKEGEYDPAEAYVTDTGAEDDELAGVADEPKFHEKVEPATGAVPLTESDIGAPTHAEAAEAAIFTEGVWFTVMFWLVLDEHPFWVTVSPTVLMPAVAQLSAKGPCVLPGAVVAPSMLHV
jgi:hypothetical protein